MKGIKRYFWNILIWVTQGLNTFLGGNPDEATSSRCWRLRYKPFWKHLRRLIDKLFGEGHCEAAYEAEKRKVESWKK
jgi:hypothetical protein